MLPLSSSPPTLRPWPAANGPALEKEYVFHPGRRWRADFAHIPSRTLIEIEGRIWIQGRHNRAEGFLANIEKYFEAELAGWTVFRLSERQLTLEAVERIVRFAGAFQAGQQTLPVIVIP